MENVPLQVSEAVTLINQTLEYAYPVLVVEGEVSSFKVNQNRYVFFDLKDDGATLNCFMTVYQLRVALENGMRVRVVAAPKLTQWGKFSLTVKSVQPIGEGAIKRSFDLLKAKLEAEGLFAPERKRPLPELPQRVGVISSTGAAGYTDFIKILNDRWGGLEITVANTQVQGADAPAQMVRALMYLNALPDPPDVIVITRGGGSADDLSAFNDEPLTRAIAASRVPVMVGVGHEVDVSLADLVADRRAATPSNAAQLLVPDKQEILNAVRATQQRLLDRTREYIMNARQSCGSTERELGLGVERLYRRQSEQLGYFIKLLAQADPHQALRRGYAIVRDNHKEVVRSYRGLVAGDKLNLEISDAIIDVGVEHVRPKIQDNQSKIA